MKNDLGRDGIGRDRSPSGPNMNKNGGFGETALPKRKILSHDVPDWVSDGATFFITINTVPRGNNQLAIPAVAEGLVESLVVRIEKGQWWPRLMLFMPDHVHGLICFPSDQDLQRVISDWKRYTSRNAGIHWQRDFFDHRIRNEESLAEKWNYIVQNPVRAGLVNSAEEWLYVWIGRDVSPKRPEFPRRLLGNFPEEVADAMVELTFPKNANIYASQYQLYLPSKENLKKRLMEWAEAELQSESGRG